VPWLCLPMARRVGRSNHDCIKDVEDGRGRSMEECTILKTIVLKRRSMTQHNTMEMGALLGK